MRIRNDRLYNNKPFIIHSNDGDVYKIQTRLRRGRRMTREDAIKIIRKMLACTDLTVRANLNADMVSACNLAIKALEQESILDKIRDQIMSNLKGVDIALEVLAENHPLRQKMEGAKDTLVDCLELIDKAETEAEDGECK